MGKQVSPCLFCGEIPCVCDANNAPKRRTRKPAGSESSVSTPTPTPTSVIPTSSDLFAPKPKASRFRVQEQTEEEKQAELQEIAILRLFEPIMRRSTYAEHKHKLEKPKSADEMRRRKQAREGIHGQA